MNQKIASAALTLISALAAQQQGSDRSKRRSKIGGKKGEMILCHGTAPDGTQVNSAKGCVIGEDKFLIIAGDGTSIGAHGLKRLYEIQVACQHGIDALKAKQIGTIAGQ